MEEYIVLAGQLNTGLKEFHLDLVLGIIINVIVIAVLFKTVNVFDKNLRKKMTARDNSPQLVAFIPFLTKLIKGLILFFVVASFLQSHGYSVSSLIAGFGITGLAVGFAAKETIANIFGTLEVLSDKIFKIGDYIQVNGIEGTVEDISMRSTKIRTLTDFVITVPNDTMAGSVVTNLSKANKRRIEATFGLTYETSDEKIQRAMEIITQLARENQNIYDDFSVFVDVLDASSINIKFISYAKTSSGPESSLIKGRFIQDVVREFRRENIDFAFPSTTVYMASVNENQDNRTW